MQINVGQNMTFSTLNCKRLNSIFIRISYQSIGFMFSFESPWIMNSQLSQDWVPLITLLKLYDACNMLFLPSFNIHAPNLKSYSQSANDLIPKLNQNFLGSNTHYVPMHQNHALTILYLNIKSPNHNTWSNVMRKC